MYYRSRSVDITDSSVLQFWYPPGFSGLSGRETSWKTHNSTVGKVKEFHLCYVPYLIYFWSKLESGKTVVTGEQKEAA